MSTFFSSQKIKDMPNVFIGFDGFTDIIYEAVDIRINANSYTPMHKMADYGERIVRSAGKSLNLELVEKITKMGGNAPLLASAMSTLGTPITFAGAIGRPGHIEPVFSDFAQNCKKTFPIGPSGQTDAIEFSDGKIIVGKHKDIIGIDYPLLLEKIGKETWIQALDESALFVSANWTMLPHMNSIWEKIYEELLPHIDPTKERWMFIDFADPAKRTDQDLIEAINVLKKLNKYYKIILGLNEAEAERFFSLFSLPSTPLTLGAVQLKEKTGFDRIVVHAVKFALSASESGIVQTNGPYTAEPAITTGAGDHFNGGYCFAHLAGCSEEKALLAGVSTSGYYVRQGKSPTLSELNQFINHWTET